MKLLSILLTAILCATASAQTVKSLGYNTTNGQVVYSGTNTLTFPTIINAEELANSGDVAIQLANRELISEGQAVFGWGSNYVEFSQPITFAGTNAAPASRANLGFSTNLNTLWTATNASNARTAVGLDATNEVTFATVYLGKIFVTESGEIEFEDEPTAAGFRTNLGLPLPALTNTSNVTMMRALAGSTNTNEPYSGVLQYVDWGDQQVELTVSNGIIVKVEVP